MNKILRRIKHEALYPPSSTFGKSLNVATFLAGLTIAVLTFLLGANETPPLSPGYKQFLIPIIGTSATLLIMSVFAIKVVLVEDLANRRKDSKYLTFFCACAFYTYEIGFSILAVLLPLLVYPFSNPGAYFILAIEAVWAVIFGVHKCLRLVRITRFDDGVLADP